MSERTAKRVLIVVSRKSRHWSKAWTSSEELIAVALGVLQQQELIPPRDVNSDCPTPITLLATERWDIRTFIVFDIFHETYDPDTAHLPGHNDLPVICIFFGGGDERASIAGKPMENKVNNDIRALHDATGPGSRPPFVVDHAEGRVPVYLNPRTCTYSKASKTCNLMERREDENWRTLL